MVTTELIGRSHKRIAQPGYTTQGGLIHEAGLGPYHASLVPDTMGRPRESAAGLLIRLFTKGAHT